MKLTMIPVLFLKLIFEMKQNVSETGSKWHFQKKYKNMSTKQEIVSDATFKAWLFHLYFNFACKTS